jgi:hypothetical protein
MTIKVDEGCEHERLINKRTRKNFHLHISQNATRNGKLENPEKMLKLLKDGADESVRKCNIKWQFFE